MGGGVGREGGNTASGGGQRWRSGCEECGGCPGTSDSCVCCGYWWFVESVAGVKVWRGGHALTCAPMLGAGFAVGPTMRLCRVRCPSGLTAAFAHGRHLCPARMVVPPCCVLCMLPAAAHVEGVSAEEAARGGLCTGRLCLKLSVMAPEGLK